LTVLNYPLVGDLQVLTVVPNHRGTLIIS